jgi:hypothetical protein
MYSSEILMCINILPYLLGKYYQLREIFIHKFMEKAKRQLSTI